MSYAEDRNRERDDVVQSTECPTCHKPYVFISGIFRPARSCNCPPLASEVAPVCKCGHPKTGAEAPLDLEPLKRERDRKWENEPPQHVINIAASALHWRQIEIQKLSAKATPYDWNWTLGHMQRLRNAIFKTIPEAEKMSNIADEKLEFWPSELKIRLDKAEAKLSSPSPGELRPQPDKEMLEAVAEDGLLVTWDKDYKFSFSQVVRLMAEFAIENDVRATASHFQPNGFWRVNVNEETEIALKAFLDRYRDGTAEYTVVAQLLGSIHYSRFLSAAAPRPQEPRCPKCGSEKLQLHIGSEPRVIDIYCIEGHDFLNVKWPQGFAAFFSPAQSPQWISVEDSLPRAGIFVHLLVHGVVQKMPAKLYPMGYAGCDGNEWRWLEESYDPMPFEEASHWQPLPEPPAQSQGAAPETTKLETLLDIGPLCKVCGTLMTRGTLGSSKPHWNCLSCGATASCTSPESESNG